MCNSSLKTSPYSPYPFERPTMSETKPESDSNGSTNSLPLLAGESDYDYDFIPVRKDTRKWWKPLAIHLLVLTGYTITFIAMTKHLQAQNCHTSLIHSKISPPCSFYHQPSISLNCPPKKLQPGQPCNGKKWPRATTSEKAALTKAPRAPKWTPLGGIC